MHKAIAKTLGWLVVTLLLGANAAYAANLGAQADADPTNWSCALIAGPGGEGHYICMDYLYAQCDCSFCVLQCL
jgi:hypothetical protein